MRYSLYLGWFRQLLKYTLTHTCSSDDLNIEAFIHLKNKRTFNLLWEYFIFKCYVMYNQVSTNHMDIVIFTLLK